VPRAELARAAARLAEGAPDAFRVAALHHPLTGAPWRSRKRPLTRRATVLAQLQAAGTELIVAGHIHQVSACAGPEFELGREGVVLTTAPGLGRPRPRRSHEACGALLYTIETQTLDVATYLWRQPTFALTGVRQFARSDSTLAEVRAGDSAPRATATENVSEPATTVPDD